MVEIDRICGSANCKKTGKHLCSGCGEEIYCSKECQKEHWPSHKLACKSAVKPEAAVFLKSFDALSIKQLKNTLKAKAASFDKKKKERVLAKLESISEKGELVKLVEEFVSADEIESLLTSTTPSADSASSSSSINKKKSTSSKAATNAMPTPSPAQLRQQAEMMRKNPSMVRNAQPAFKNMTDEQIRSYADQLELAASDPNMMKEVERMSKLTNREREDLQVIQEGLSGAKPMDYAWMDRTISILKNNPGLFKTMMKGKGAMMGGVTDEQVESFIDMASKIEAWTLKLIFRALVYLGSCYKPAVDFYGVVDKWTFGMARYIALAIFAFVAYYISMVIFFCLRMVFGQVYKLVMLGYAAAGGKIAAAPGAATSTVLNAAGTTAYTSTVKSAVEKVAATVGAAGVAKVASDALNSAAAGATAGAAGVAAGGEAAKADADYDF